MRRNYYKSIVLHIVLLLLILLFPFVSQSENSKEEEQHVIVVDFSRNNSTSVMATPKGGASSARAATKSNPTHPKVEKQKVVATATKAKSYDNDNLQVSQKLNAEKPKVKPFEKKQEKVIPPPIPQPSKEEIEAAKKAKELAEKKSEFADLLSKSKKKESPDSSGIGEGKSQGAGSSNLEATGDHSKGSIRGVLGNRKVLRIPTIKDDSQKKGRVVVKICVDAKGNVVSSNYTLMGSTTSDTYLIKLAEEGALGYKFSPSTNPKECGKVTIEFLLK
ncbi:MAG: outer membrane biosynthesis protein TonB [Saprospiraceae bacterium]|jgi:outer membrane biosynthesis protein TonB